MTTKTSTYPLRLPRSLKVSAMTTAEYFAERKARADMEAFDRILSRIGGEPPCPGDELQED